jgi:competence protein ComEA
MICNTRPGRAHWSALLTALCLALATSSFAVEDAPRLVGTVNVNTATHEELQLLPGVGESRANAVIALRKQRGGFKTVDELTQVKGIGDAALERLRPFVRTEGKTTARRE